MVELKLEEASSSQSVNRDFYNLFRALFKALFFCLKINSKVV
jgi:hypothetical protein